VQVLIRETLKTQPTNYTAGQRIGHGLAKAHARRPSRLRLVDELAGPSGNMGFGWGKQRNNVRLEPD